MTERAGHHDPFYIGYEERMPASIARRVRPVVLILLLALPALALTLVAAQKPFDVAFFEFGTTTRLTGMLVADPYPSLLVDRPGHAGIPSRYLLVAAGKHGLDDAARSLAGRLVTLEGTLIHRDDQTMIELVVGSLTEAPGPRGAMRLDTEGPFRERTLRGEIVGSKCFLGVMKPGFGKPHRACAALCILGGIPPVFVPRNPDAPAAYLLLVGDTGQALNEAVLPYVAETVEITGQVGRRGDQWVLRADADSIHRASANP